MPARRTRVRGRAAAVIERDRWADYALECWTLGDAIDPFKGDLDAAREYYDQHGEAIVEDWVRASPGSRPACWWAWDAPQALRDGEKQVDYLERHGLLEPREREAYDRKQAVMAEIDARLGLPH